MQLCYGVAQRRADCFTLTMKICRQLTLHIKKEYTKKGDTSTRKQGIVYNFYFSEAIYIKNLIYYTITFNK